MKKYLLIPFLIVGMIAGCISGPNDPKPPTDYPVYFANIDGGSSGVNHLYKYSPVSRRLDTIDISPINPKYGLQVSADGSHVYLSEENKISIMDLATYQVIGELPFQTWREVEVSPDGSMVAVFTDSLHILRTEDYSNIYTLQYKCIDGQFSLDSRYFYVSSDFQNNPDLNLNFLVGIDLEDKEFNYWVTVFPYMETPNRVSVSADGNFIYMSSTSNHLMTYNITNKYTVLTPFKGKYLAILPDSSKYFFSGFMNLNFYATPYSFLALDQMTSEVVQEYPSRSEIYNMYISLFVASNMTVTPDSKWLILNAYYAESIILLYDIKNDSFEDFIEFPRSITNGSTQTDK